MSFYYELMGKKKSEENGIYPDYDNPESLWSTTTNVVDPCWLIVNSAFPFDGGSIGISYINTSQTTESAYNNETVLLTNNTSKRVKVRPACSLFCDADSRFRVYPSFLYWLESKIFPATAKGKGIYMQPTASQGGDAEQAIQFGWTTDWNEVKTMPFSGWLVFMGQVGTVNTEGYIRVYAHSTNTTKDDMNLIAEISTQKIGSVLNPNVSGCIPMPEGYNFIMEIDLNLFSSYRDCVLIPALPGVSPTYPNFASPTEVPQEVMFETPSHGYVHIISTPNASGSSTSCNAIFGTQGGHQGINAGHLTISSTTSTDNMISNNLIPIAKGTKLYRSRYTAQFTRLIFYPAL